MIAGTPFTLAPDDYARDLCSRARGTLSDGEVEQIQAQCDSNRAAVLACDDAAIIVTLEPLRDGQHELFVWLAVANRYGAFDRHNADLDLIARDMGAEQIGFCARRRGWARRLGPEWKRRGENEFTRSVV